jgi:hypothetical protein
MNREEAIKATKNGAIAACISACITLLFVLYAIFSNDNKSFAIWNDPSNFFDIVLIICCAFGIYKKSRFAAVLIFVYFIFAKIVIGIESGKFSGIGMGLVFLYFYGKAIQGAFAFHKIEKAENPNYKSTPKWMYYAVIPIIVIFLAMIGFGLMSITGVVPSTEVQIGAKMQLKDQNTLISNSIISTNDKILYFYSGGLTSILEGGSVLTEDRVILYLKDENKELKVYELYFDDIASVELIQTGNSMNDSIYRINGRQPGAWLQLALSAENRGDVLFIEALRTKITELKP